MSSSKVRAAFDCGLWRYLLVPVVRNVVLGTWLSPFGSVLKGLDRQLFLLLLLCHERLVPGGSLRPRTILKQSRLQLAGLSNLTVHSHW